MIIDLPDTTTAAINRRLVDLRDSGGAVALGRVMTLIIVTDDGHAEDAIRAANDASREHPCRVVVLVSATKRGGSRLDGQIRVGGDAGASEVIVLRLFGPLAGHGDSVAIPFMLPDAPIVVWWPGIPPEIPAEDPLGRMAQRRIVDASRTKNPIRTLQQGGEHHAPGTTDLAWTRISLWRALLAAALDQPPYEDVSSIEVTGGEDSSSTDLLAAWLALYLEAPVHRVKTAPGSGTVGVVLQRRTGTISLHRPPGTEVAVLHHHDQPERRVALHPRQDNECLAEELRRLDPDDVFGDVVTRGLRLLNRSAKPSTKQAPAKQAPAKQAPAKQAPTKQTARKTTRKTATTSATTSAKSGAKTTAKAAKKSGATR